MKISFEIDVLLPGKDDSAPLQIQLEEGANVVTIKVAGEPVCMLDWDGNLKQLMERALHDWSTELSDEEG